MTCRRANQSFEAAVIVQVLKPQGIIYTSRCWRLEETNENGNELLGSTGGHFSLSFPHVFISLSFPNFSIFHH